MKKRKLVMLLSMTVIIGISSCSKDDDEGGSGNPSVIEAKVVDGNEYNDWIATVKALIVEDEARYPGGGYYFIGYELTSGKYENGGFKLNLPNNVPSQYLASYGDMDFDSKFVSNTNAKAATIWILAYNEQDREIGSFRLAGTTIDEVATYLYADRNFSIKGNDEEGDVNLSFRKGWNIFYTKETNDSFSATTSKPGGINFKWYFEKN